MRRPRLVFQIPIFIAFSLIVSQPVFSQSRRGKHSTQPVAKPVIWRDPGPVSKRDLRYGPGSQRMAPVGPFRFVEEDKSGESPKFVVRDARDHEWRVKLGPEAQSETVATRLVWAVGYFAEEAVRFVPQKSEINSEGLRAKVLQTFDNLTSVWVRCKPIPILLMQE